MLEKEIEQGLIKAVKKRGGLALKFVSVNMNGVPDRIVILPGGLFAFIELKAPGKKMRPLQLKRKKQLEMLGMKVFCIDGLDEIEEVLRAI